MAMSIFAGQMFGCFVMGALADSFGRKPCVIAASVLVAVGGYASALADSTTALMVCRFAVGLGVGAAFVPVDMLAEACPDHNRTTRTQLANLSFSVGVVAITVIGAVILEPWGVEAPRVHRRAAAHRRARDGVLPRRVTDVAGGRGAGSGGQAGAGIGSAWRTRGILCRMEFRSSVIGRRA